MKKIFLMMTGILLASTFVYAQTPKAKPAGSLPNTKSIATLIERCEGKIISLQKADTAKSSFGKLSIADESGKKKDFDLIAKTQIYSNNSSPIVFTDLKKGDRVIVLYVVTLKRLNNAITITQTK